MVLKPGQTMTVEAGTELAMDQDRLRLVTHLQRSAGRLDLAAHLRALASNIESQVWP